jgi:DNA-binding beta-propeller fold protein YncE
MNPKKLPSSFRPRLRQVVLVGVIALLAVFSSSGEKGSLLAGSSRVVSIDQLPEMNGEMCEWVSPAMSRSSFVALRQQQAAMQAPAAPGGALRAEVTQRKPVRAIGDPYGNFSAVGLDLVNNEVILQDENQFRILVYDRTANTPPTATMSEPKRIIHGDRTNLALNCAIYVDPKNGDIYTVNNDSIDSTVIFSRQQNGNVAPAREVNTPHGTFGIAVDEQAQEMFLTVQHSHAVVVFPKMASGDDEPIRNIQGDRTGLGDPHGIALDTKNNLIFVANFGSTNTMRRELGGQGEYGREGEGKEHWPMDRDHAVPGSGRNMPPSITVYSKTASGDTPPLRTIRGPKTLLNWPAQLAVDSGRGELFVANDMGDSILVFSVMADGDVAPIRVLKGPKTQLKYPNGLALDLKNNELWVANFGNHSATVYPLNASGDTAPLRMIRSGPLNSNVPTLGNPFPVAFDTKRGEILVPN